MSMKCLPIVFCFLVTGSLFAQSTPPTPVVFDTDMGPDYDDVGAIALLHAFADSGRIKILATIASDKYEGVAAVLSVFNTYFGRPGIPVGVPKGPAVDDRDSQHWTDSVIAHYPHAITRNAQAEDAVALYRQLLARAPDTSVVVITVGFLTNLRGLLHSLPDKYAPLDGRALIAKKVKRLVSMGGRFPEGKEFNLFKDAPAARDVSANWPTEIVFSGFEIGLAIKTGLPLIHNRSIANSPVQEAFRIAIPQHPEDSAGRCSWDETAVLVGAGGHLPWYSLRAGKIVVAEDGSNRWSADGAGQYHLVAEKSPKEMEALIDALIQHQPRAKNY